MPCICYFVSDLHGRIHRYDALFHALREAPPAALFLGGDLLPHGMAPVTVDGEVCHDFLNDFLLPRFQSVRDELGERYPRVFLILGNDDDRGREAAFADAEGTGVWEYAHNRRIEFNDHLVFGYAHVPPTPFLQKDWERYDVSRYVDPGCVSPEDGFRSIPVEPNEIRYTTIAQELEDLMGEEPMHRSICLFHTPPHQTRLDRAALDGKSVDHVPLDVHVGSIAVRRFIETRQPLVTLHGHIHESSRLTQAWQDRIGNTRMFNAAYHDPELALVVFDLEALDAAERRLI